MDEKAKTEIDHLLSEVSAEEVEKLERILIRLGLRPGTKPQPKHKKEKIKGSLKTYNLRVVYECKLCRSTSKVTFIMEANEDGDQRISRRSDEDLTPFVLRQEWVSSCPCCQRYLEGQSKEELINIILKIVRGV